MESITIQLARVALTTTELRKIPPKHAGFLVASCLAIDDILLGHKLLLLALNSRLKLQRDPDGPFKEIAFAEERALSRGLAAKLFEFLNLLDEYIKKCTRKQTPEMESFLKHAKTVLASARDDSSHELAQWYRNKATSHYSTTELAKLATEGDLGDETRTNSIYLHPKDGNSHYILGEQVLLSKLCEGNCDPVASLKKLDSWIGRIARDAIKLHHDYCITLFKVYFPSKSLLSVEAKIPPEQVGDVRKSVLPLFWRLP